MLHNNNIKTKRRLPATQIIALGFLALILLGGLILELPICNVKPIEIWDSMFTSASAICVTGLGTMVTIDQFTMFGQLIILILIQIGGLRFYGIYNIAIYDAWKKDNFIRQNFDWSICR